MAYLFNGTSNRLTTSSVPVSTVPLTLACWFKSTSLTLSQALIVLSLPSDTINFYMINAAGGVSGDPLRAQKTSPAGNVTADSSAYSSSTWNHAAGTFTSTSVTSWLNGSSFTTNGSLATEPTVTATCIGARLANNTAQGFVSGDIAEVGIWNVALTASEILSLSKGVVCSLIRPQSLVFYAPLIRDLVDIKGSLTITNNNSTTVSNHPRIYY